MSLQRKLQALKFRRACIEAAIVALQPLLSVSRFLCPAPPLAVKTRVERRARGKILPFRKAG